MKKHSLILLAFLIIFSLIGCSVESDSNNSEETIKLSDHNNSENSEKISDSSAIHSSTAALDYFMPFNATEEQAVFYEDVIADNDIDYDYFNESYDTTTLGMRMHQQKYADIWRKELEYSLENFLSLLSEEDQLEFETIQTNWENSLKTEFKFIGEVFLYNEPYHLQMGSIFPVETATESLRRVRERTLYIKYLQYCMETGAPNYPNEITVSFSYKSAIR